MKEKLTCQEAKEIAISQFLGMSNIIPVRLNTRIAWYLSPLHNEKTASFKVDLSKNLWYDFGLGKGGSIIDLVCEIHQCDMKSALDYLSNGNFKMDDFKYSKSTFNEKEIVLIVVENVIELSHPKLILYLKNRLIDVEKAVHFCKEIHYKKGDKKYYSIGFKNDKNGWELRNAFFKTCLTCKHYTKINYNQKEVKIFEGFFDFLSFITLFGDDKKSDFIILNSVTTYLQVKGELSHYLSIDLYLDNDPAGDQLTYQILDDFGNVIDNRKLYKNYKDLNEYLCNFKKKQK